MQGAHRIAKRSIIRLAFDAVDPGGEKLKCLRLIACRCVELGCCRTHGAMSLGLSALAYIETPRHGAQRVIEPAECVIGFRFAARQSCREIVAVARYILVPPIEEGRRRLV